VSTRDKVADRASEAGLSLPPSTLDGLSTYFELLRRWNRKVSLTALPVEALGDEAVDRLLIEPVIATQFLVKSDANVLDVGSGSGSPAIPIKLACPALSLRMVESRTRKVAFLREAVRTLSLGGTTVAATRHKELLEEGDARSSFDVVTVRAVRIDRETLSDLRSFLIPGGLLCLFSAGKTNALELGSLGLSHHASHLLLAQWGSRAELYKRTEL
jgi:16S rRNA (guanine527-N7)-methyltransferase